MEPPFPTALDSAGSGEQSREAAAEPRGDRWMEAYLGGSGMPYG
jgi:hypothetical protein